MSAPENPLSPENFSNFGEILRYLRERAHLSQRELATLVGYHYSYISYLEKNMRSVDEASLLGRFVPALGLEAEKKWVSRLLELSKQKRDDPPAVLNIGESAKSEERSDSIPTSLTSMIGRGYESAMLRKLILDPAIRLISVLGPPGVGKTCLALNVARIVQPAFTHGVLFVDLTSVREPQYLLTAIASALGLAKISRDGVEQTVITELRNKNLLIVLDNFEQVVDSAPQLLPLFGSAPGMKMLVTSREVLRLRGEQEFHLSPLPTPPLEGNHQNLGLLDFPSVELFVERARAVKPEFNLDEKNASLVAEICTRLDGLPLAIELAAARIRTMSLVAMFEHFNRRFDWLSQGARDLPEWRQTLAGAIEWSVESLSEKEQTLFQRLSIFSGGWTLSAAEEICSDEGVCLRSEIFHLTIQLVEKSLILPEDENGRYSFLETLREYALNGLKNSSEWETLQKKHFNYYLSFMRTAKPHINQGGSQTVWLSKTELERSNLRLALEWVTENRERANQAMEFGMSIHNFWLTRSYIREARYWLDKILALDDSPTAMRANLLRFASDYAGSQGDYAQAQVYEEEAMHISKSLGDEIGIYFSMDGMAMLAGMQGDYSRAAGLLEEVLVFRRQQSDKLLLTATLNNLAIATRRLGDLDRAKQLFLEVIQINRETQNLKSLSHSLHGLGDMLIQQGNFSEALHLLKESADIRMRLRDMKGLAHSLDALAMLTEKTGSEFQAAKLEGASIQIREKIGSPISPATQKENENFLIRLREKLGQKQFENAWFDGQTMSLEQIVNMVNGM